MAATLGRHYRRYTSQCLRGLQKWNAQRSQRVFSGKSFYPNNEPQSDDPRDPDIAKRNEKPHIETPTTYHSDLLSAEPLKGKPYDKIPFRIQLEAGKTYSFCACGYSKQQPFCDGSHKTPHLVSTKPMHVKYRPIRFKVEETKEYWLCQCKQSNKRPFCDGSHKRPEVQDVIR